MENEKERWREVRVTVSATPICSSLMFHGDGLLGEKTGGDVMAGPTVIPMATSFAPRTQSEV